MIHDFWDAFFYDIIIPSMGCMYNATLFRRLAVEVNRNEQIEDVRNPYREVGRRVSVDGEGRRNGLEQDVGETQGDTDTQVKSHTSFPLLRREREPDDRQDEGRERSGDAPVVFHFEHLDVGEPSLLLLVDVFP